MFYRFGLRLGLQLGAILGAKTNQNPKKKCSKISHGAPQNGFEYDLAFGHRSRPFWLRFWGGQDGIFGGFGMVFGGFLEGFWDPGASKVSVWCRRGAILQKFTYFSQVSFQERFFDDFEQFWEPFWEPKCC